MKKRHAAFAAAAMAAMAVVGLGFRAIQPDDNAPPSSAPPSASASAAAFPNSAAAPAVKDTPLPQPAAPRVADTAPPALGSDEPPSLRVDAAGHLIVDAGTRDELERLLALNNRDESLALLRTLESTLGPLAYREALDAYYAFQNYQAALAQASLVSRPPTSETDMAAQLDALHATRVTTLGERAAAGYFGDEEAVARRMVDWMRANPMPGAPFEEKILRAQEATLGKR